MFRKKKSIEVPGETAEELPATPRGLSHSSAKTAHLIGPGCVKLQAGLPLWKPVQGTNLTLHPRYLERVLCYGNVDFTTAVLHLFWQRGIHIAFLSQDCRVHMGMLQPTNPQIHLNRLHHLAAEDRQFALHMSQTIIKNKLQRTIDCLRYFQRQSIGSAESSKAMTLLRNSLHQVEQTKQLDTLRGVEGRAAAIWYGYFATIIPSDWTFAGRKSHPPADPLNALLSLGYTLATTRCVSLLAAHDLDPRVGFLHQLRPGRNSLACDLVESLRVPLVDRLVLKLIRRRQIKADSLESHSPWRLNPDAFRLFLREFEEQFQGNLKEENFHEILCQQIDHWTARIRDLSQHKKWELKNDDKLD